MVFGIFTKLFNYHKTIFRTSSLPSQRNLIPSNSHCPLPSPLGTTNLISVSMNLPTLDSSCKWNHIICGHLWLAYFTYDIFKGDHVIACISTSFIFLLLNKIALYRYTPFCSPINQLVGIWVVSTFWLLQMTLVWIFMSSSQCGYVLISFESTSQSGIDDYMVTV